MPKRLVRFALISYTVDGRTELASRGATVDLSEAEAKKYDALGATVKPDVELDRPGTLGTLPESPSDEELIAWVIAATPGELAELVRSRPELASRVEGASEAVVDLRKTEQDKLDAAIEVSKHASAGDPGPSAMIDEEGNVTTRPHQADPADPAADSGATTPGNPGTDASGAAAGEGGDAGADAATAGAATAAVEGATTGVITPEEADAEVAKNADTVSAYLSENPETAADILAAEERRANATGKDPRKGVLLAVQAAAGHTA